jgi:elongation factor 1-gamma
VLVANQDPNTSILPKDVKSYAEVLQWCSFANAEILPSIGAWFRPTVGRDPYNKKSVDAAEANIKTILTYLDSYLLDHTYLVGERLSLADIVVTAHLDRGFQFVWIYFTGANDSCLTLNTALHTPMSFDSGL